MPAPPRQNFYIASTKRHDTRVKLNGDEILAAATAMALKYEGITPTAANMVFAATNVKFDKTGPWMLSMPAECKASITQGSFTVPCIQLGKQPAVQIKLLISVARPKGENTMRPNGNTMPATGSTARSPWRPQPTLTWQQASTRCSASQE